MEFKKRWSRRKKMRSKMLATFKYGLVTLAISVIVHLTVTAQGEAPARSLEGVWEVATTPRNCTTGDPIPAAAFVGLYTFHQDGTMMSWYSSGTPATGHGLWRREPGWSGYSFKLVRILRTPPPTNSFSGKQEIGGTLTLSESGNEYVSDEYMIVYSIDGVPSTPACINSVGTRFKFEQ
jgi:hypothetical protein